MQLNKHWDTKKEKFSNKETEVILALYLFPDKYIPRELVQAYLKEQFNASRAKALIMLLEGKNTRKKSSKYIVIDKSLRNSINIKSIYCQKLYNSLEEYKKILQQFIREVYSIIGEPKPPQFSDEVEYHFTKAIKNPVLRLSGYEISEMAEVIARNYFFK